MKVITEKDSNMQCPSCSTTGKGVSNITLNSLIKEARKKDIKNGEYFYCLSENCSTVYFSNNGKSLFSIDDLTVRVGLKEKEPPRPVCYCFNHTAEEIHDEVQSKGRSTVVEDIKGRMQEGCSCETKNPQGSCCLGNVQRFVDKAYAAFGAEKTKSDTSTHDCCASEGQREKRRGESQKLLEEKVDSGSVIDTKIESAGKSSSSFFSAGAIISAVAASLCCVVPFVMVLLGLGGSWLGSLRSLTPYRPIFILATFGFLAVGFYNLYRTSKVEACKPGTLCAVPQTRRAGKVALWTAAFIAVVLMVLPYMFVLLV